MAISEFVTSPDGLAGILSAICTLIAGFGVHMLQGRARIVWFSPNSTRFNLPNSQNPNQPILIDAGQVMVQNLGRKSATDVQITSAPGPEPAGYALIPNVVHQTERGPKGEWIVKVPFISPSETLTLQVLNGPPIDSVRSKDCSAKFVPVVHQRLIAPWIQNTAGLLAIIGMFAIFSTLWQKVI